MAELLAALDAFLQEHRRCGELDGGVEGGAVVDELRVADVFAGNPLMLQCL